jgi:hypothetical protein
MRKRYLLLFAAVLLVMSLTLTGQTDISFDRYHTPEQLNDTVLGVAEAHPGITRVHEIASSPGGSALNLLEIGPETAQDVKSLPAILIMANLEGTFPISSEAAIFLIERIIAKPEVREDRTWYVFPVGNPDAAIRYFESPLKQDTRNKTPFNDDMDDATDEDGVEDLDGDGLITSMRVRHPEGVWVEVPSEPRLLKKADGSKGEKGVYKVYTEGLDNDRDGKYNEDGPGGVNIGINFPHLFKFHTGTGGAWAGSEVEAFNLLRFVFDHPEIGMTFAFGASNFCLTPPRGGRKGSADLSKIEIPDRIGERFGLDTSRTYTIDEIKELMQPMVPAGMQLTDAMIASFLGLGAVVNPLPEDLKFYKSLSEDFKELLKENGLDGKRLEPAPAKDGSFELWAYYHLGLPSFSMDFWTLPEVEKEEKGQEEINLENLAAMSSEEFLALGEEKIDKFLKASNAPPQFPARRVIQAVEGGQITPKRVAEMLKDRPNPKDEGGADPKEEALLAFSDKELEGKGFADWTAFEHPTLGPVEIGGPAPFASTTPPASMIQGLLEGQVPWVFHLSEKMARIKIAKTEAEALGSGLHRIKVWVENEGYLPYPTEMGQRNNRIIPVIVTLEGSEYQILEGKKRHLIKSIPGHSTQVVSWIVRTEHLEQLTAKASTTIAWTDEAQIQLGGTQ